MDYSIKVDNAAKGSGEIALSQRYDLNVSYKDLGAVCDAVRYMMASSALELLERVIRMETPLLFKRHNKHMGSRHELGGKKGKYPRKASAEVRLAILNAMANAKNNGNLDAEKMYVIHAAANKTQILKRSPSKGSIAWGRGMYGRSAINHSDLEFAKIEIGIASGEYAGLTEKMKYFIRVKNRAARPGANLKQKGKASQSKQDEAKPAHAKITVPAAHHAEHTQKITANSTAVANNNK